MNQALYAHMNNKTIKKSAPSWALVAHAYNPSYSGGSQFEASVGK
jgi:hypothetical protein